MKLSKLVKGYSGPEAEIRSVCWDTRKLEAGALFFAIPGFKVDGGQFIDEAFAKGAAAVVCAESVEDARCIRVADPRAALAYAGAKWYGDPADKLKIIGITGTNGKTTTTYLLKGILEQVTGEKVGLIGTNQNLIGDETVPSTRTTPESFELQGLLAQMAEKGCKWVVMEVSSHALVLSRVAGITFAAGIFSNLTEDHLDFHKTMEAYRDAKALLFKQCKVGVVNLDDEAGRHYLQQAPCPMFTYSEKRDEADLTAKNLRFYPDKVEFEALTDTELCRVTVGIPGGFSVYNALAALAACRALGLEMEACCRALGGVRGVKGRVEVVPTAGKATVIIDYAHTPDALENVLSTLRELTDGKLYCVFGCGGDRDRQKRPIMGEIVARLADVSVVTSDNPRSEDPVEIIEEILAGMPEDVEKIVEPDRPAAICKALALAGEGDTVLLAGKGHETYQEVNGQFRHMDEREIVAEYFARK